MCGLHKHKNSTCDAVISYPMTVIVACFPAIR
jgi:hypothetical protein